MHETVNHTLHFVDPKTGVHTQNIESYWNKQKNKIKRMNGCRRSSLDSYLDQFMWLERNENQKFVNFCKLIQNRYVRHGDKNQWIYDLYIND